MQICKYSGLNFNNHLLNLHTNHVTLFLLLPLTWMTLNTVIESRWPAALILQTKVPKRSSCKAFMTSEAPVKDNLFFHFSSTRQKVIVKNIFLFTCISLLSNNK